ncbi:thioredoxin domain-containing protein [Candidatus Falkowbacteria bacterium]|nr:thioredoxin domain-containing protein [Candidatus Falkowbacteria bacterium]MBT5503723.1 thioredoxin domain-containing protein [Candidatus Falkowbacteria bacterium]MBT6573797.1 thioredoxin domain-containing protein [Candidatus Falkowbacteria bacterium]MBT7348775.1 thioredoxin domain-containing protein [Candidatus Falkowbacteria bacterium]MBT7500565.1 thioredoxin domain-containing protein [Candidatus Falkowbacteria bacterium]
MDNKEVGFLKPDKSWYKRWWAITIFIVFGLLIFLSPLYLFQFYQSYQEVKLGTFISEKALAEESPYVMSHMIDDMSPSIGNPLAKIQIVEFGDFNCSRCLMTVPIVKKIINKYGDKVNFYWRNYPVISASSVDLAKGAICANQQDKFWEYHDLMFQNQGKVNANNLAEYVLSLNFDIIKFNNCMEHNLTLAQARKDYFAAQEGQIIGTPTFFINGFKLQGVIPMETWDKVITKFQAIYEKNVGN